MNTGALGNADNQDNRTAPETETKKWWEKFASIIIVQEKLSTTLICSSISAYQMKPQMTNGRFA